MSSDYRCELLAPHHNRREFTCGVPELDRYFQQQVTQDARRRLTSCFVCLDGADNLVGFYTMACAGIPSADLPEEITRRLPRYPMLPAVRIGRLAVHRTHQGRGLGGELLMDAAAKALRAEQANFALIVDAKNEVVAEFYQRHGFVPFVERRLTLFLPLASTASLFRNRPG